MFYNGYPKVFLKMMQFCNRQIIKTLVSLSARIFQKKALLNIFEIHEMTKPICNLILMIALPGTPVCMPTFRVS